METLKRLEISLWKPSMSPSGINLQKSSHMTNWHKPMEFFLYEPKTKLRKIVDLKNVLPLSPGASSHLFPIVEQE
jgi:hypothetical protein